MRSQNDGNVKKRKKEGRRQGLRKESRTGKRWREL